MKKEEIKQYNVEHHFLDIENPLSVGNGNLAVTVDGIGTQTFYDIYNTIPLTSISATCFVTDREKPVIKPQLYQAHRHSVGYFTSSKGQEDAFKRLRAYPYKFHFFLYELWNQNEKIKKEDISHLHQVLDIYEGVITSHFKINENLIQTRCMVDEEAEIFRFEIDQAIEFKIKLFFPKTNCNAVGSTFPECDSFTYNLGHLYRMTEHEGFDAYLTTNMKVTILKDCIELLIEKDSSYFELAIHENKRYHQASSFFEPIHINLNALKNEELKRRMILSMYLLKVNSCGTYPPSETGLTMNSWNSKFHLEMHPWHSLWLAKYGLASRLIKQLDYYKTILESSKKRAKEQGYLGARFPKMTSFLGEDSPSNIGPLLLWQQPHFLLMLDACYEATRDASLILKYDELLNEIILFLESFLYLGKDGYYHLDYPIIPAQECFDPAWTRDPIFEAEYVRFAFQKMIEFKKMIHKPIKNLWYDYIEKMVMPAQMESCYLAVHDMQGKNTYQDFAYDHPLVLMPYSFIQSDRLDKEVLKNTFRKVLETYHLEELWGWDFPMMALTAIHLGMKKEAIELLLLDTPKNQYLKNGHNKQANRTDLPLYLPGNGAFLLALKELIGG